LLFKRRNKIPPAEPIPSIEDLVKGISAEKYPNITSRQVRDIVSWIVEETNVSRDFGLVFDNQILNKEINFYLDFINTYGGIAGLQKILNEHDQHFYTQFFFALGRDQLRFFKKESMYFFNRLSQTHETYAPNAFECHLISCRSTVISNIDRYPLDHTP
jgi:hypothetical protein